MRCPITYEKIESIQETALLYSLKGLCLLDRRLKVLKEFPYTNDEQLTLMKGPGIRTSISGQQPKLLINLNRNKKMFETSIDDGRYILKPQSIMWPHTTPANEDLTMKLAGCVGIETPIHGLLYCKGGYLAYFIKRFDRGEHPYKIPLEDFAQLQGKTREGKYDSSIEKVAETIEQYCTFPVVEKKELFKRTIFIYLTGHQDMHLKKFSLISVNAIVMLSPAYGLVNSTIVHADNLDEIALPLNGKKRNLTREDLITYYGMKRLRLKSKVIDDVLCQFSSQIKQWKNIIAMSFLSEDLKKKYIYLLDERKGNLDI